MRVIAGTAKATRLVAPRSLHVRPTLDRVKTAMFNLLRDRVDGARVLDIFSGSGSLGIEALSRGAAGCVFVELTKSCLDAIRVNLDKTRLADRARVIRGDVFKIWRRLPADAAFDLVLAAPPYKMVDEAPTRERLWQWFAQLVGSGAFAADGLIVLEHRRQKSHMALPPELAAFDIRTYGDTTLSLLVKRS